MARPKTPAQAMRRTMLFALLAAAPLAAAPSGAAAADDAFDIADYHIVESPLQLQDCPLRGWVQCVGIWWRTPHIGRFLIEPQSDDYIKDRINRGRVWEPHVVTSIERHVVPGSVALDIGAYIGTHAMLMGRLIGKTGGVYAFEPQRKVFLELRHNVQLNGLGGVVTPLRYSLGAKAGVVEMNTVPEYRGGINAGGVGVGSGGDRVEMRTLDSFGFRNVSLVKIDVEGFEDAVLAGAAETIRASKPVILIEIIGGTSIATVSPTERRRIDATVRTIEAMGYRVHHTLNADYVAMPI